MDTTTGLNVADNEGAAGERQAMWELAQRVKARLESGGYTVRLTKESRDSYASLRTRADIGNTCQILVRLHYDTNLHAVLYPGEGQFKRNGESVVYVDAGVARASEELARAMFPSLQGVGITGIRNDCGGTSDNTGSAFVGSVLSRVPVVLIENDPALVRDNAAGQERVADAVVNGINTYFHAR
jgi:N-acetylmuramoyl-L-alanine amidase